MVARFYDSAVLRANNFEFFYREHKRMIRAAQLKIHSHPAWITELFVVFDLNCGIIIAAILEDIEHLLDSIHTSVS